MAIKEHKDRPKLLKLLNREDTVMLAIDIDSSRSFFMIYPGLGKFPSKAQAVQVVGTIIERLQELASMFSGSIDKTVKPDPSVN